MKTSMYALAAAGAAAFLLAGPEEASAGDVRVSVHFGVPVVIRPPVVYYPVVVHAPARHVHRARPHPHRHFRHRHVHHHAHRGAYVAGYSAPGYIVNIGVDARLR